MVKTSTTPEQTSEVYHITPSGRGVLLVRMRSKPINGVNLPDAVFTFRPGDPQYELWSQRFHEQEQAGANLKKDGRA